MRIPYIMARHNNIIYLKSLKYISEFIRVFIKLVFLASSVYLPISAYN